MEHHKNDETKKKQTNSAVIVMFVISIFGTRIFRMVRILVDLDRRYGGFTLRIIAMHYSKQLLKMHMGIKNISYLDLLSIWIYVLSRWNLPFYWKERNWQFTPMDILSFKIQVCAWLATRFNKIAHNGNYYKCLKFY